MKKRTMSLLLCVLMISLFTACGGGAAETSGGESEIVPFEKHTIPYPEGYDTMSSGASCYDGCDDHFGSPYFAHLDVYNMTSTDTLTILPNFETYQQTTEYTCGPASALMVLNHYGVTDYDELKIAEMSGTSEDTGIGPAGLVTFFDAIGWNTESNLDQEGEYTFEDPYDFENQDSFIPWVLSHLETGTPIMVDWLDWAGHWQVIIGYDTMGTDDNFGDDVIIFADPYDTSDQYQDGYYIFSAERFFYMWREGVYEGEGPLQQPWVIATPAE